MRPLGSDIPRLMRLTKANQIGALMELVSDANGARVKFRVKLPADAQIQLDKATTAGRMAKANLN